MPESSGETMGACNTYAPAGVVAGRAELGSPRGLGASNIRSATERRKNAKLGSTTLTPGQLQHGQGRKSFPFKQLEEGAAAS